MKILRPLSVTAVWLLSSGCQTVDTNNDRPARSVLVDKRSKGNPVFEGTQGKETL